MLNLRRKSGGSENGPTFLDRELEQEFSREGYVVHRLMDASETKAFRDSLCAQVEVLPEHGNDVGGTLFVGLLERERRLLDAVEPIIRKWMVPRVAQLLREARPQLVDVAIKPAHAGPVRLHHHPPTTANPFARRISCWMPMDDVGPANGCLRVIPRSHQLVRYVPTPGQSDYFAQYIDWLENALMRDVPVVAGEVVLFEDSILHGSAPNSSQAPRMAATCNFVGVDEPSALVLSGTRAGSLDVIEDHDGAIFTGFVATGMRDPRWPVSRVLRNRERPVSRTEFTRLLSDRADTAIGSSLGQRFSKLLRLQA